MKLRILVIALVLIWLPSQVDGQIRIKGRKNNRLSGPVAPTNLVATAASDSQINLTWTDNATNEDGYNVERCLGTAAVCAATPSLFAIVSQLPQNATAYANTGLAATTTYAYRVRAFNSAGNSSYSNIDDALTTTTGTTFSYVCDFEGGSVGGCFTACTTSCLTNPTAAVVTHDAGICDRAGGEWCMKLTLNTNVNTAYVGRQVPAPIANCALLSTGCYFYYDARMTGQTITNVSTGQYKTHLGRGASQVNGWSMDGMGPEFACAAPHAQVSFWVDNGVRAIPDLANKDLAGGGCGLKFVPTADTWYTFEVWYKWNSGTSQGCMSSWLNGTQVVNNFCSPYMGWADTTAITFRTLFAYEQNSGCSDASPCVAYVDNVRVSSTF